MNQPIACSLTPAEAGARTDQTAAIAGRALVRREPTPGGERLVFEDDAEIEAELRDLIAAEAQCCPFLEMELRRVGETLELDVTGPAEARPIIEELFA
jgi:MerR family copper efflux transcriptional regulator